MSQVAEMSQDEILNECERIFREECQFLEFQRVYVLKDTDLSIRDDGRTATAAFQIDVKRALRLRNERFPILTWLEETF